MVTLHYWAWRAERTEQFDTVEEALDEAVSMNHLGHGYADSIVDENGLELYNTEAIDVVERQRDTPFRRWKGENP